MSILTSETDVSAAIAPPRTISDLLERLGGIDPSRVRFQPTPGSATEADCIRANEVERTGRCELIDGTLVEKRMGSLQTAMTTELIILIGAWVKSRNLGYVHTPDSMTRMSGGNIRQPDISFWDWNRLPNRRLEKVSVIPIAPTLAIEIVSPSNTNAELVGKRRDYFASGSQLVWEVDPELRTVTVFASPTTSTLLRVSDTLTGGIVLPGFSVSVGDLFAELDRHG